MNGLKHLIDKPTRISQHSSTLINVVFTTHENDIASQFVHSLEISDHHLMGIVRKLNIKTFLPRLTLIRNYKNYSAEIKIIISKTSIGNR